MTESSLTEISKALDHLRHKFLDDPDVSHATCMEELQKSIQKEIDKHGLSNNLICTLSKGGCFFEVEIKNLKLVGETKEVEFSYFCRKITFSDNDISSHFSIRNKDLSVNISKSRFPSIEDIRYYDKVFFEFSGNTSQCPINFSASEKDTMNIVLKDNNFSGLFFKNINDSKYEVSLIGENQIDFLGEIPDSNEFDISFNRHQNIDPENKNISHHKRIFLALRKKMTRQGDKVQESILTKEIMKCEKAILKKDPWHLSWQDRMILWLEDKVSGFGFSWFRALIILLFFNAIFATIFVCNFVHLDWGHVWISSLNPTFNIKGIQRNGTTGIAMVMVLQKVTLAFFLYEIIKSLRRFSRK